MPKSDAEWLRDIIDIKAGHGTEAERASANADFGRLTSKRQCSLLARVAVMEEQGRALRRQADAEIHGAPPDAFECELE